MKMTFESANSKEAFVVQCGSTSFYLVYSGCRRLVLVSYVVLFCF